VWGLAFSPRRTTAAHAHGARAQSTSCWRTALPSARHDPWRRTTRGGSSTNCVQFVPNPYLAVDGRGRALFLVTDGNEFRQPDFARVKAALKQPILFDGRTSGTGGCASFGFTYYGVGRRLVVAEKALDPAPEPGQVRGQLCPSCNSIRLARPSMRRTNSPARPDRRRRPRPLGSPASGSGAAESPGSAARPRGTRRRAPPCGPAHDDRTAWRPVLRHCRSSAGPFRRGPARTELERGGEQHQRPRPSDAGPPGSGSEAPPSEDPKSTTPPAAPVSASRRSSNPVTVRSKNAGSFRSGISS